MLHASLSRGFADLLSTMQVLTNRTVDGFTAMGVRMERIDERVGRVEEGLGEVDERLGRVEDALRGPGRN